MRFLVLDGNPNATDTRFSEYLSELEKTLQNLGHPASVLTLRNLDIRYCTGCWGCWVKTPGKCVFVDDSEEVCREYIQADFVLLVSPVLMGFTSALLKKVQDRLIPLLHPYIDFVQGECHHEKRYPKYPRLGVLLKRSNRTEPDDLEIIKDILVRFALNFKTELDFFGDCDQSVWEVAHALDGI